MRIGRSLDVLARRSVVAEVGRRRLTQRSAGRSFHPRGGTRGDGGLARPRMLARKRYAAAAREGAPRAGLLWKTSRDHTEIRHHPRKSADVPCRRKSPQIAAPSSSSRRGWQNGLGSLGRPSLSRKHGRCHNEEATGVSEVRLDGSAGKNTPRTNPSEPTEADPGVVKRSVPRSFGRGCRPTNQRRGASLGEMPGTNEARVLVIEAVGSISRSVRIGINLRGASQGRP